MPQAITSTTIAGSTVLRRANAAAWKTLATRALFVGLLVGIFALRFKFLVLLSLGVSALVFACLSCVRPFHRVAVVVLLNFSYWVAGGMISHGIGWSSCLSGEFWRGEGRCFFFYLPLLAVSIMHIRQSDLRFLVKIICVLTVIGAILGVAWLVGFGHLFQAEEDAETGELIPSVYFIGLLTSHTGAGAFWATVTAFLLGYSLRTAGWYLKILAVVGVILTLATGGRAATLGLLAVVVWLALTGDLFKPRVLKILVPATIPVVAGTWLIVFLVPDVSERMAEMFSPETFSAVAATVSGEPTLKEAAGFFHSGSNLEHHNLVLRVFLWKYAFRLFLLSPLVGIGFCRFNDPYLEFAGVPHVAYMAVGGERYFGSGIRWEYEQLMTSTGNAHNSYLHVLAENGIIGLALFLYLWYLLYRYCQPTQNQNATDQHFETAYCHGCRAMVVSLLVTALAGHALAAPSGGILITTVIGAWLAYSRVDSNDERTRIHARVSGKSNV